MKTRTTALAGVLGASVIAVGAAQAARHTAQPSHHRAALRPAGAAKHTATAKPSRRVVLSAAEVTSLKTASATGTLMDRAQMTGPERAALVSQGINGPIKHLGTFKGVSFYLSSNNRGRACILDGRGAAPNFGSVTCMDSPSFPATTPVYDDSDYTANGSALTKLEGFAADGVAKITVFATDGTSVSTGVVNNVYVADPPASFAPATLVGYDSAGQEVYRQDLRQGVLPSQ